MEKRLRAFHAANHQFFTETQFSRYNTLLRQSRELPRLYKEVTDRAGRNLLYALQQSIEQFQREVEQPTKKYKSDYQNFISKLPPNIEPLPTFKYLSISPPLPTTLSQLSKLSFPILSYKRVQLIEISAYLLRQTHYGRHQSNVTELVSLLSREYNSVSYHNFSHAFSLQLLLHQLWARSRDLTRIYTAFDFFIAQVSALAHDLGHRGTNSIYEIKQTTELAVIFNNDSVLQNMHISIFFKILRNNPQVDFLAKLPNEQQKKTKQKIVSLILSTDMAKHHRSLQSLTDKVNKNQLDLSLEEDKQSVLEMLFHGCDIGNPCFDYKEYMNWAALLSYEFNQQAKMEEDMGLTVSPFLKYTNNQIFLKGQVSFIKMFTIPIWKQITDLFPATQEMYDNAVKNIEILQR